MANVIAFSVDFIKFTNWPFCFGDTREQTTDRQLILSSKNKFSSSLSAKIFSNSSPPIRSPTLVFSSSNTLSFNFIVNSFFNS